METDKHHIHNIRSHKAQRVQFKRRRAFKLQATLSAKQMHIKRIQLIEWAFTPSHMKEH